MKIPRRGALALMFKAAVVAATGGLTVMGCGGSSGGGGGAAPVGSNTPPPTQTTTVLASLEKHVGGSQNIGRELNTTHGDKINTINSPQGVLTGTTLVYTVNGQDIGNSAATADVTNQDARPENHQIKVGDTVEWFDEIDRNSGSPTKPVISYTVS